MPNTKLEIHNITKSYNNIVAVDDLSLSVENGQIKTLLGPSGCGKSTTLRSVAGLETPDSGEIYIDGELVFSADLNVSPEDRGLGMVFQSYAVWPHMTVEENVMYPLTVNKEGTKQERVERTQKVLEAVGLERHSEKLASNLSGGQQQRVAIARALILEPEIILFDEPLSNLDAKLRRSMRAEIKRICEQFTTTMLYVTHAQDEAMYLSDEIAIMNEGEIVEEGTPLEIYNWPQKFFTMDFMGFSNTFSGLMVENSGSGITVAFNSDEYDFPEIEEGAIHSDELRICFRPKHARILSLNETSESEEATFVGTLTSKSLTRDFVEYTVDCRGTELMVRSSDTSEADDVPDAGSEVTVAVDKRRLSIFDRSGDRVERTSEGIPPESGSEHSDSLA